MTMNEHQVPESTSLVTLVGGQPLTTTLTVSEGVGNQHKNIIAMVRQYQADLEEFGPLAFETRKGEPLPHGGFGKATEYAILNERQAGLLLSFMRNTNIVRIFKKSLIRAFFAMAEELRRRQPAQESLLNTPPTVEPSWDQCEACEEATKTAIRTLQNQLLAKCPLWDKIRKYHRMGLNNKEIGTLTNLSKPALRRQMQEMDRCGLLCPRTHEEASRMALQELIFKCNPARPYGIMGKQLQLFPVGALR